MAILPEQVVGRSELDLRAAVRFPDHDDDGVVRLVLENQLVKSAHFSFDPNLPLPADHIAAGSPAFDTLRGL